MPPLNSACALLDQIVGNPEGRWILTGPVNSGKTTLGEAILREARAAVPAWRVGGLAARGIFLEGAKIAYTGADQFDGESFALARKFTLSDSEREFLASEFPGKIYEDSGGPRIGGWVLLREGLERAIFSIERAVRESCALILADEFGPVEMQGGGLRAAIDSLARSEAAMLLIARESLVSFLSDLYSPIHILARMQQSAKE